MGEKERMCAIGIYATLWPALAMSVQMTGNAVQGNGTPDDVIGGSDMVPALSQSHLMFPFSSSEDQEHACFCRQGGMWFRKSVSQGLLHTDLVCACTLNSGWVKWVKLASGISLVAHTSVHMLRAAFADIVVSVSCLYLYTLGQLRLGQAGL